MLVGKITLNSYKQNNIIQWQKTDKAVTALSNPVYSPSFNGVSSIGKDLVESIPAIAKKTYHIDTGNTKSL